MSGITQGLMASFKTVTSNGLTSSDFTTSNRNGGGVTWTGTQCVIITPNTSCSVFAKGNTTKNSNIIYAQTKLTWSNNTASGNLGGLWLSSGDLTTASQLYNQNYVIGFASRATQADAYRLWIRTTSNVYSYESTVVRDKDVKITYNTSNNEIKFWYWGGSSWTQLGTTQTYDIRQSGVLKIYLANIDVGDTNTYTFDNTFWGSAASDYTTQYP